MSDRKAPERVWAYSGDAGVIGSVLPTSHWPEYVRSDIAERQIAELQANLDAATDLQNSATRAYAEQCEEIETLAAENARLRALPLKDEVERVLERVLKEVQQTNDAHNRNAGTDFRARMFFTEHGDALLSRLRAAGWRHGPYGYLIKPIGLNEEHWHLAIEPSAYPDEEVSVPLYADQDQLPAAPSEQGGNRDANR